MLCKEANGRSLKPNFISIDWAHIGKVLRVGLHAVSPLQHEHTNCTFLSGDAHEIADYLNFGGRLGTGQPCNSGLDCATGACSPQGRCQCQTCETGCISGCLSEETCISSNVTGVHHCVSPKTSESVLAGLSNDAGAIRIQSSMSIILVMLLWSFIRR